MSAPQYTAPASGGGGGGGVSGSGTPGTVPVWSGSTSLGDSPLTVSGTAVTGSGPIRATGTSATTPAFTGSDTDTGIYFPAANQVRLATNGQMAFSIDSSQRIGIGTASPANRLTVRTGVQFEGITLQEGSANNYVAASLIGSTATNDGGVLGLYYNGVQTVQIFGNGASWFNSGNVAIGTTTPTTGRNLTTVADLDVYGVRVGRGAGANSENVALGQFALNSNTSGTGNTAAGAEALTSNSTGSGNAAFGKYALRFVSGSRNTGLGADAGSQITTGVDNVCIGNFAQLAASSDNNSIVIGSQVTGNGPNTVTIGSSATTDNYFRGVIRLSNAAQGVRLPATPTNSNANTLDCYEEGTWTPTDQSGAGLTFTNVNGTYTRIGRTVIAQVTLTYPTTSSTAHAQISLPIALTTATTNFGGATIGYMSGGTVNNITALIATGSPASSTSNIKFYNYNGAGNVQNSNFSGVLIILTAVYNIA